MHLKLHRQLNVTLVIILVLFVKVLRFVVGNDGVVKVT